VSFDDKYLTSGHKCYQLPHLQRPIINIRKPLSQIPETHVLLETSNQNSTLTHFKISLKTVEVKCYFFIDPMSQQVKWNATGW